MSIPYTVEVSGTGSEVNVNIKPQPIATEEVYSRVITARFQGIIMSAGDRHNSIIQRSRLKRELISALTDFHNQGMIKPKEDDVSEQ